MFIKDGKRFNTVPKYTDPVTGEKGIDMSLAENRARFGVTEIPDPVRESTDTHYVQELDDPPYISNELKPLEILEAARIAKIDQQILAKEREALDQGLIRTIIDDLLIRSLDLAAKHAPPITEAQLLDPQSPYYSRAYEKVHANAVERAVLRAQR